MSKLRKRLEKNISAGVAVSAASPKLANVCLLVFLLFILAFQMLCLFGHKLFNDNKQPTEAELKEKQLEKLREGWNRLSPSEQKREWEKKVNNWERKAEEARKKAAVDYYESLKEQKENNLE